MTVAAKEGFSKFNSVMLAIIIALLSWTVKGVQQLKEQNSANAVMLANSKDVDKSQELEILELRNRITSTEIEIVKVKTKIGL